MPRLRLLVVHPHVHGRRRASLAFAGHPHIEVVGSAATARIAHSKITLLNPDVLLLDPDDTDPDAPAILADLRRTHPALGVVTIPRGAAPASAEATSDPRELTRMVAELAPRIMAFAKRLPSPPPASTSAVAARVDVIAIGVSTGGPNALAALIPQLPTDLPVPIVIVQHMPPLFTRLLAERLTSQAGIPFQEGVAGSRLRPGEGWIAPGDFHMVVERRSESEVVLDLNQGPLENSCRPAVDVLFRSVAHAYGSNALGIVLTGMGNDGLRGAGQLRAAGAKVLAQDEASSVVWGMPGAVSKAGLADAVLPLDALAAEIVRLVSVGRSWAGEVSARPVTGEERPRPTPRPVAPRDASAAVERVAPVVPSPAPVPAPLPPIVPVATAPAEPETAPSVPVPTATVPVPAATVPVPTATVPEPARVQAAPAAPEAAKPSVTEPAKRPPARPVIEGAAILPSDFDYVSRVVYENSAIVLEKGKEYLVESRLLALARRAGIGGVGELVAKLRADASGETLRQVVEAMTTNETSFFRDGDPFQALRKVVLPELIQRRGAEKQLRIWCAASSSGQEPYSIAMLLREHFPQLSDWRLSIVSSDLSQEMLERCRGGRYSQLEVNRGLPAAMLVKYFDRDGTHWRLKPEVRAMVEFFELNLATPWPALPPMDVVFMRNVLIYFDADTKRAILGQLKRVLRPDGVLFLGGAETTFNLDEGFVREASDRVSFYRLAR